MARIRTPLIFPELVNKKPGQWDIQEVPIQEAAVMVALRKIKVPKAHTRAQILARLHELTHVKYSPGNWTAIQGRIYAAAAQEAAAAGEECTLDPNVILALSKMVEENRIDWLLWDRHNVDLRPAREVLDWAGMPIPEKPIDALRRVLQLAWTVWASRGLGGNGSIPNPPPVRTTDPATAEHFDKCWARVLEHPQGEEIALTMVRSCMSIYQDPTHSTRDRVTLDLSRFFPAPKPEPEEEEPPQKEEEQEEQQEAEQKEKEQEEQREEESTGVGAQVETQGHIQFHDHTASIRRPSTRIARRYVPQPCGTQLVFPQRYMLDKTVFGRRILTEAGIMVDISGSMNWTNEMMQALLAKLPAVWIGVYGEFISIDMGNIDVIGRICTLAKRGRFSVYEGKETGFNGGNTVDFEAIELLARWPKPRFWLSDGLVMGGKLVGPHPDSEIAGAVTDRSYLYYAGAIVYAIDRLMKAHEIYRVSDMDTMLKLVQRQRVTVYRSCANWTGVMKEGEEYLKAYGYIPGTHKSVEAYRKSVYPDSYPELPYSYQL